MELNYPDFNNLSFNNKQWLSQQLAQFLTPAKISLVDDVLAKRTDKLTLVLDDVYQPHNCSAIIRSAEILGLSELTVLQHRNQFKPSTGVSLGAAKWLQLNIKPIQKVQDYQQVLTDLRLANYQLVTTHLDKNCVDLDNLDYSGKIALFLGTEEHGLNPAIIGDKNIKLPQYGFTASFNVSVAAALFMNMFRNRLVQHHSNWQLSAVKSLDLKLAWYIKIIPNGDLITKRLLQKLL